MESRDLNFTKLKIVLVLIFLCLSFIVFLGLDFIAQKNKNDHLNQVTQTYERAYSTVYSQYKELSYIIFTGFSRLSNIQYNLEMYAKADQDEKKDIQEELYESIIVRYKEITKKHLRNINFIDADKKILLKTMNLKHNGKKISQLRKTIHEAFRTKKPVDSYEVGKNGAGFKFVYPIVNQEGKVLGAMAITFGAEAITSGIMEQYYVLSNFFISDKRVNKFNVKRSLFKKSHHPGFLFDKLVLKELKKVSRMDIKQLRPSKETTDLIREKGFHGKPQSLYSDEINMIFTTIPIYNKVSNDLEAVLTVRSKGNILNVLNNYFYVIYTLALFFIAIILLYFHQEYTKQLLMKNTIQVQDDLLSLYKQKEKELKDEKARFQLAMDGTKDGLWDWNVTTGEIYYSPRWKSMIGYGVDELKFNFDSWKERVHPDDIEQAMEDIKAHLDGVTDVYINEHRLKHKDGSWVSILARGKALFDENGEPLRFVGFHTDLTKRKELDRQLLNSEKMSSLGEMIGNIAHQWRQPLSVISTISSGMTLQKQAGILNDAVFEKNCKMITEQTEVLSETIKDFQDYIRGDMKLEDVLLSSVITKVINIESAVIKNSEIEIIKELDSTIILSSYPNALVQSIINIVNNAKDALKDNVQDDRLIFISSKIIDDEIIIGIKDNAGGVPEDIINRIYEAYFTTKHKYQGTGLGLHMTYNLITIQLQGKIENRNTTYVYNGKEYKGAEFIITLPKKITEKKENE